MTGRVDSGRDFGSRPGTPEGIAGGHVTPARDSAPVRGQRVVVQGFVLYAAQSWRRGTSSVENMWRACGEQMNAKSTPRNLSGGRALSSLSTSGCGVRRVGQPERRIVATATAA